MGDTPGYHSGSTRVTPALQAAPGTLTVPKLDRVPRASGEWPGLGLPDQPLGIGVRRPSKPGRTANGPGTFLPRVNCLDGNNPTPPMSKLGPLYALEIGEGP